MNPSAHTHQAVYVSRLSGEFTASLFAEIARISRYNNHRNQVQAILLFDGERFCQWLEGAQTMLDKTIDRIFADPRHADFLALARVQGPVSHVLTPWQSGFVEPESLDTFIAQALDPQRALQAFHAMAGAADLSD